MRHTENTSSLYVCFRKEAGMAHWIRELATKSNNLSFISDIENHMAEGENYSSKLSFDLYTYIPPTHKRLNIWLKKFY